MSDQDQWASWHAQNERHPAVLNATVTTAHGLLLLLWAAVMLLR